MLLLIMGFFMAYRSRSESASCVLLISVVVSAIWTMPANAQSSARPSPVEVVVPKPPTPVMIEDKRMLVYELHVTNFGPSALVLTGIQVFASSGEKLAEYGGPALSGLLHPLDESSQMA